MRQPLSFGRAPDGAKLFYYDIYGNSHKKDVAA